MYKNFVQLNPLTSPSLGSVTAFDGEVKFDSGKERTTYLFINDCFSSIKLVKAEYDTMDDFINKMELLRNEIDKFINYLKQ